MERWYSYWSNSLTILKVHPSIFSWNGSKCFESTHSCVLGCSSLISLCSFDRSFIGYKNTLVCYSWDIRDNQTKRYYQKLSNHVLVWISSKHALRTIKQLYALDSWLWHFKVLTSLSCNWLNDLHTWILPFVQMNL